MLTTSIAPRFSLTVALAALTGALLACGGGGAPVATSPEGAKTAPPVTHEIAGKEDCVSCHVLGAKPPLGMPESHAGRGNAVCSGCHQPAPAKAGG